MTPHNLDPIAMTYDWFKIAVPEPTSKNGHTQLGVHFEEIAEMVNELTGTDDLTQRMIISLKQSLEIFANHLKNGDNLIVINDPKALLDSLCDQMVTATGTGYMANMDVPGAMHTVVASNYSKFEDGVAIFDDNRKIMKGKDYFKADLSTFVTMSA